MLKHIVMYTIKDQSEHGTKAQAMDKMKSMLMALNGKVPSLGRLEVSTSIVAASPGCDIVLYSEFASQADLEAYMVDPLHQECVTLIRQIVAERRVVDYEV